jgi:hypothetical protein
MNRLGRQFTIGCVIVTVASVIMWLVSLAGYPASR